MKLKIFMVFLLFASFMVSMAGAGAPYWPEGQWRVSSPRGQGMDPEYILRLLKALNGSETVHSLLIIRNGFLVTEAYFSPYHRNVQETVYSLEDCFMSALTGIAVQKGLIKDVSRNVPDFFPRYSSAFNSERKKSISIKNLLTMTSGLDWPWRLDPALTEQMIDSRDPLRFILDLPMAEEPGARFNYSGACSQILSAVIKESSGISAFEFARTNLFIPLGITEAVWSSDGSGRSRGSFGLRMKPADAAKFGYLYLQGGVWKGKQIIPAEWVAESTRRQAECSFFPGDNVGYGYHWWLGPGCFYAGGWSGHYLIIMPAQDIVAVLTSENKNYSFHPSSPRVSAFRGELRDGPARRFIPEMVRSAVISSLASPDGQSGEKLNRFLEEAENPGKKPSVFPPSAAQELSGKKIVCPANGMRIKSFSFRFDMTSGCRMTISRDDGSISEYPVGMDGVYRTSELKDGLEIAFMGTWTDGGDFMITQQELWESERYYYNFQFKGNEALIDISGSASAYHEKIIGSIMDK